MSLWFGYVTKKGDLRVEKILGKKFAFHDEEDNSFAFAVGKVKAKDIFHAERRLNKILRRKVLTELEKYERETKEWIKKKQ